MLGFTKFIIASSVLAASVLGAPASGPNKKNGYQPFPLKDGFPSPNPRQLKAIERRAGGSLPNGGLPTQLTDAGALTFQLIAAQETFEVAYFTNLLQNVTNNCHGYKLPKKEKAAVVKIFDQIVAQEELHAIGANAILASAGREPIEHCRYRFPVHTLNDAISLAATFTDLVLSVLPQVQALFAADGGQEAGLIPLIGSIIAQEGEQDGFFRFQGGKVPSAAPFLTGSNAAYAFNALQAFLVPGSCPNIENLVNNLPTYSALTVVSTGKAPKDTTATFSVRGAVDPATQAIVYLTGQNVPVTARISNLKVKKGVTTFSAPLPFDRLGFAKGLTVAALVDGVANYPNAAAVAGVTVAGPGLIEVQ